MFRKLFPWVLISLLAIVACEKEEKKPTPDPVDPIQLQTPAPEVTASDENSFTISWAAIEHAAGYAYQLNQQTEETTTATSVSFNDLEPGTYSFTVKAVSSSEEYTDSEWGTVSVTLEGEPEPEELTLEITINEVGETSANITVTPSRDDSWFFARVITVAELINFDIYEYDEDIINFMMENPDREDYIYKGEQTLNPERLQPDYTYMVVAFDYLQPTTLYRTEFTTEEADVEHTFEISNLEVGYTTASFTVTPSSNNEYWYFEWMSTESYEGYENNAIIHAYYGLQNLALMYGYNNIGEYLQDVAMMGVDDVLIEDLLNEHDYTVMVFYVDPNSSDPTNIYDWNHTPVHITTLSPTGNDEPTIDLSNATVVNHGSGGYDLSVTVHVNDAVIKLSGAAGLYESCANYFDQGWEAIKAFFWLKDVGTEALAAAKTEEGFVFSREGLEAGDYIFLFEGSNSEGVMVYNGVRFDPTMFE